MNLGKAKSIQVEDEISQQREAVRILRQAVWKTQRGDQGIGMSSEVMAKIFDPYYTTKPAGHGLGLSVTHSIFLEPWGAKKP
jgi:signal transduction histidine kinase